MNSEISNKLKSQHIYLQLITIFIISIGTIIFYFSITSGDEVVGFLTDDAVYLLMAEHYSPWNEGVSYLHYYLSQENRFPPLYPFLMGLLGVDASKPELASIVTTSCLLATFFIYGLWVWQETKNLYLSLSFPIIFSLLPSTILFSQGLWSEFLFMCFLYAVILCLNSKSISANHWLVAAIFIGLACLTRTIGVSLVAAFFILLLIERPAKRIILAAISAAPFIFWQVFNGVMTNKSGYFDDLINYWSHLSRGDAVDALFNQTLVIIKSWVWLLSAIDYKFFSEDLILIISIIILAILFFAGLTRRLYLKKFDAICLPFYLLIILVWPHTDSYFVARFLYPLLPLFLYYLWVGIDYFTRSIVARNSLVFACLILITALASPSSIKFINRAYTSIDDKLMPYRRSRIWMLAESEEQAVKEAVNTKEIIQALKRLKDFIPENDCLYSAQTSLVLLHANRISGALPSAAINDEQFTNEISDCRFILAMNLKVSGGVPEFYPLARINDDDTYKVTQFLPDTPQYTEPVMFLLERQ